MSAGAGHVEGRACTKCKVVKPRSEFYPAKTKYGHYPSCKECSKAQGRRHFYANHEKLLAKKAAKRAEPEWRVIARKNEDLYKARHPQKAKAHHTLNNAIRDGRMARGSCEACGVPNANGHHDDYSKPLEVHWLCHHCHSKEHRRSPEGLAATRSGR